MTTLDIIMAIIFVLFGIRFFVKQNLDTKEYIKNQELVEMQKEYFANQNNANKQENFEKNIQDKKVLKSDYK